MSEIDTVFLETPASAPSGDSHAAAVDAASEPGQGGEVPWDMGNLGATRGTITLQDGRTCIGRVGAPPSQEATSARFWFWIPEDALVEATQIVTTRCKTAGREIHYYALVDEVRRSSRRRGMGHEVDEFDGDLNSEPLYGPDGMTYAEAAILRADPPLLTPPRERSHVTLASAEEAGKAYGADEMENGLAVGLIKNGGDTTAGAGSIDLDYLLGANGGHLNVNGAAGRGTKSSFLLHMVYLLLNKAEREARERPSDPERLRVVPIVFNVKGYDLFHIDRRSKKYSAAKHEADWAALGVENPIPFRNVTFLAAQQTNGTTAITIQGRNNVQPYSWGLEDLIEGGLFAFLFASDEGMNDNFQSLLLDLEDWLTEEFIGSGNQRGRRLSPQAAKANGGSLNTFDRLSVWASDPQNVISVLPGGHVAATIKKLSRRLRLLTLDSRGLLRRDTNRGAPLSVVRDNTSSPIVIDLNWLAGAAWLQRFVVATVLRQLTEEQTYRALPGLKYLVVLDELNRFAPRGGRDPITKLVEQVASEMRSQGVLLFGAQQQASLVSEKVIENAGIRALGKTGVLELSSSVWRGLSDNARRRADALPPNEKLLLQDSFRQPMHVRIPMPPWAMLEKEAASGPIETGGPAVNGAVHRVANMDY
jgi:DNA helicase HerA-like ATPase